MEEVAATRFAAGFRLLRVCTRFWSTRWGGQCGGVPMAIGAPSHIHGLSFTRKPQPMNKNSPRTLDCGGGELARREWPGRWERGEGEAARCSCAEDRADGRGRPCALQRQDPTVLRVRSGCASASVRCPQCKIHGQVQFLVVAGSGQFRQLWLLFSGGGTAAGGWRQVAWFAFRPGVGGTQVMSPCELVSVTAVHRHVVVDIHTLVVNPLQKQQQQKTTTTTTTTKQQHNPDGWPSCRGGESSPFWLKSWPARLEPMAVISSPSAQTASSSGGWAPTPCRRLFACPYLRRRCCFFGHSPEEVAAESEVGWDHPVLCRDNAAPADGLMDRVVRLERIVEQIGGVLLP